MTRTRRIAAIMRPRLALPPLPLAVSLALLFVALLIGTLLLIVLPVALLPGALAAQQPATPAPAYTICDRCVAGHRYLVSSIVADPFVTTHFRNNLGGGFAGGLTLPVRDETGEIVDSAAGVGFVTLDLEYQYAVKQWLGLRVGSSIQARVGTSARSLVASGAEALRGFSLGASGTVWRAPTMQVALTADARRGKVYVVDPYTFAQAVREDGLTPETRDLLMRVSYLNRITGGVRAAWTVKPWIGLNGVFEIGGANDPSPEGEGTHTVSEIGASAGFDFGLISGVPVGLTLGTRYQGGSGRSVGLAGSSTAFALGVFYTAREFFLIGAETSFTRTNIERADLNDLDATVFRFVTRYDF